MVDARLTLGMRVKRLRYCCGLSQEQLSEITGIHRSYISRVETGESSPSFDVLVVLAQGLGISPSELVEGIGVPFGG